MQRLYEVGKDTSVMLKCQDVCETEYFKIAMDLVKAIHDMYCDDNDSYVTFCEGRRRR